MNTNSFKETLLKCRACTDAREWAGDKSFKEVYETCERGDWLLWLFAHTMKTNTWRSHAVNTRLLLTAKIRCAELIVPILSDGEIKNQLNVALDYCNHKATHRKLVAARVCLDHMCFREAYTSKLNAVNEKCLYTIYNAVNNTVISADGVAVRAANTLSYATPIEKWIFSSEVSTHLKTMADIVRDCIPIEMWDIYTGQNFGIFIRNKD